MHPSNKFWWFVGFSIAVTLVVFLGMAVLFWRGLSLQEKQFLLVIFKNNLIYAFSAFILMLVGVGFILDGFLNNYIIPVNKIADEVILIHSVNSSHRIQIEAGADIARLVEAINETASRFAALEKEVREKNQQAKDELEEEKNILAGVIAELPKAVLICNTEGRILLYNRQAKIYLAQTADADTENNDNARFVGLGRSVFGLFDKNLIVYALDEIRTRLASGSSDLSTGFVQAGDDGRLIGVEVVPILRHDQQWNGFVLTADDLTRQLEHDSRTRLLLQSLMRRFRASLGSIHATIEAIIEFPGMSAAQRETFHEIILRESAVLGDTLNRAADDYARQIQTHWPLVPVPADDLMGLVSKKAAEKLGIHMPLTGSHELHRLKADSYSLLMTLLFLLKQLKSVTGNGNFASRLTRENKYILLDLLWEGQPLPLETLKEWEDQVVDIGEEGFPMTCREICDYHEAEIITYSDRRLSRSCIRLILPAVDEDEQLSREYKPIFPPGRPEFYDFDLFNQPGQIPELEKRKLTELSYTIFDTETTGLDPRGGDEILSIGAVRIVNNRLLREEIFDRLVDPQRSIPSESTLIHGLDEEVLQGQPIIDQVLPLFHRFAEDSVLIAHNAAFDMRMLQLKEARTGVRFINPVLDTMLLAAIVNPWHQNHQLEEIACRTGVRVVGRHTALGDAMMTAEVFLKLIPLLEKKKIYTLRDAISASQKNFLARLKY